jgi:hypothetical protein
MSGVRRRHGGIPLHFFQQIPRATTPAGSLGQSGPTAATNTPARLAPATSKAVQPRFAQRETVAEAIRSLDAQFPWPGAEPTGSSQKVAANQDGTYDGPSNPAAARSYTCSSAGCWVRWALRRRPILRTEQNSEREWLKHSKTLGKPGLFRLQPNRIAIVFG